MKELAKSKLTRGISNTKRVTMMTASLSLLCNAPSPCIVAHPRKCCIVHDTLLWSFMNNEVFRAEIEGEKSGGDCNIECLLKYLVITCVMNVDLKVGNGSIGGIICRR